MKLPLGWLKEFVNIDVTPEELSQKLLGIGFEVEEIIYTGENIENVVVGKIIDIKKHFSADKLQGRRRKRNHYDSYRRNKRQRRRQGSRRA